MLGSEAFNGARTDDSPGPLCCWVGACGLVAESRQLGDKAALAALDVQHAPSRSPADVARVPSPPPAPPRPRACCTHAGRAGQTTCTGRRRRQAPAGRRHTVETARTPSRAGQPPGVLGGHLAACGDRLGRPAGAVERAGAPTTAGSARPHVAPSPDRGGRLPLPGAPSPRAGRAQGRSQGRRHAGASDTPARSRALLLPRHAPARPDSAARAAKRWSRVLSYPGPSRSEPANDARLRCDLDHRAGKDAVGGKRIGRRVARRRCAVLGHSAHAGRWVFT